MNQKNTKCHTHLSTILIGWSGRTATFNAPPQSWSTNQKKYIYYTHQVQFWLVDQDGQPHLTHPHRTDQPIEKTQNIIHTQIQFWLVDQDGQPRLTHPHRTDQPIKKNILYTPSTILIGWSGRTATFNAPPQNWSTNQKDTNYYTHSSTILIGWSGRTATFNAPPQNWSTNQKDTNYILYTLKYNFDWLIRTDSHV